MFTEQKSGNFQECPPIKHQRTNVNIFRKHLCTQNLSGTCQLLLEVFLKKDTEKCTKVLIKNDLRFTS